MIARHNKTNCLTLSSRSLAGARIRPSKANTPMIGLPVTLNVSGVSAGLGKDTVDLGQIDLRRRRLDDVEKNEVRVRRSAALTSGTRVAAPEQGRLKQFSKRLVRVARCVTVVFW